MIEDKNYKFRVSLSKEKFMDKEIANAMIGRVKPTQNPTQKQLEDCKKNREIRKKHGYKSGVSFIEEEHTAETLMEALITGRVMCHLFSPKQLKKDNSFDITQKNNSNFKGSYVIGCDIDNTKYQSIEEYINRLTSPPTFYYSSYSHKQKENNIRFRLIYVYDTLIDNLYKFRFLATLLIRKIEKDTNELFCDKCGRSCSQYFNGTCISNPKLNVEYGNYNLIYSFEDLGYNEADYIGFLTTGCDSYSVQNDYTVDNELNRLGIYKHSDCSIDRTKSESSIEEYSQLTMSVLNDWDRLDEDEFMHQLDWNKARNETKYVYRCESEVWLHDRFQKVDNGYFRLYWFPSTLKDGNKRRRNLYQRMCLRRIIKPDITKDQMIVNTLIDCIKFIDNSDRVINKDFIIRNIDNCYSLSLEEIESNYSMTLNYLRTTTKPKKGYIYKNRQARSRESNFMLLDTMYDCTLSVKENMDMIRFYYEYNVGKSTLYSYCMDRNINTSGKKLSDEELYDIIDAEMSIRKNREFLKDNDIKVSETKLRELLKKKKELKNHKFRSACEIVYTDDDSLFNYSSSAGVNKYLPEKSSVTFFPNEIDDNISTTTINLKMENKSHTQDTGYNEEKNINFDSVLDFFINHPLADRKPCDT